MLKRTERSNVRRTVEPFARAASRVNPWSAVNIEKREMAKERGRIYAREELGNKQTEITPRAKEIFLSNRFLRVVIRTVQTLNPWSAVNIEKREMAKERGRMQARDACS